MDLERDRTAPAEDVVAVPVLPGESRFQNAGTTLAEVVEAPLPELQVKVISINAFFWTYRALQEVSVGV